LIPPQVLLLTRSLSKVFHLIQALNHNLCIKNEAFLSDTLIPIPVQSFVLALTVPRLARGVVASLPHHVTQRGNLRADNERSASSRLFLPCGRENLRALPASLVTYSQG
jgi:hypothetical protein